MDDKTSVSDSCTNGNNIACQHRTCNDSALPMAPHWLEELPVCPVCVG